MNRSPKSSKSTRPLKPFGQGSMADRQGYTLPILTGWLEDMTNHEIDENVRTHGGRKAARARKALEAVQLLNEACEEESNPS